jgi:hypothetical protein
MCQPAREHLERLGGLVERDPGDAQRLSRRRLLDEGKRVGTTHMWPAPRIEARVRRPKVLASPLASLPRLRASVALRFMYQGSSFWALKPSWPDQASLLDQET